jgi:predicted dehydrogenase
VLFNYRYNPAHWKVEELVASGKIGNVKSVHFEWLLVGTFTLAPSPRGSSEGLPWNHPLSI